MQVKVLSCVARTVVIWLSCVLVSSAYGFFELGSPSLNAGENVRLETGIVNGLVVDRYTWRDARDRPRSASLVGYGRQLEGRPRGGYAVQFTYQVPEEGRLFADQWRTVEINPPSERGDAGFGYFVSHELHRSFDANICADGSNNCTIASVHGQEDDSPLGLNLPGSGHTVSVTKRHAVHEFKLNYPHWGTTIPVPDPSNTLTPSNPALHKKYNLPVTIHWIFRSGKNYPLWRVTYDVSSAPIDTVSVDMRGPYGYLIFDPTDGQLTQLEWGEQYYFATNGTSVSTDSEWAWNTVNTGARYNLLVADQFEMGLVQSVPYSESRTGNTQSSARNTTSAAGLGCPKVGWRMPCAGEWPYQSIQYEEFGATPSSVKKIAWGTAPYVGTSMTSDDTGEPFEGYPEVSYAVWITFDNSGGDSTRSLAASIK